MVSKFASRQSLITALIMKNIVPPNGVLATQFGEELQDFIGEVTVVVVNREADVRQKLRHFYECWRHKQLECQQHKMAADHIFRQIVMLMSQKEEEEEKKKKREKDREKEEELVAKLQSEFSQHQTQRQTMKSQYDMEISSFTAMIKSLEDKLERFDSQKLKSSMETQDKTSQLMAKIAALQESVDQATKKQEEEERSRDAQMTHIRSKIQQLCQLYRQLHHNYRYKMLAVETVKSEMAGKVVVADRKIELLVDNLAACQSNVQSVQSEKDSVQQEVDQLQLECNQLMDNIKALSSTNVDLNDAITDCERMLQEREAEIARLSSLESDHRVRLGESIEKAESLKDMVVKVTKRITTTHSDILAMRQELTKYLDTQDNHADTASVQQQQQQQGGEAELQLRVRHIKKDLACKFNNVWTDRLRKYEEAISRLETELDLEKVSSGQKEEFFQEKVASILSMNNMLEEEQHRKLGYSPPTTIQQD